jgi:hypothetical protein
MTPAAPESPWELITDTWVAVVGPSSGAPSLFPVPGAAEATRSGIAAGHGYFGFRAVAALIITARPRGGETITGNAQACVFACGGDGMSGPIPAFPRHVVPVAGAT